MSRRRAILKSLDAKSKFLAILLLPLFSNLAVADSPKRAFTIGVVAPLSGPSAQYGRFIREGLELAQSQYPTGTPLDPSTLENLKMESS